MCDNTNARVNHGKTTSPSLSPSHYTRASSLVSNIQLSILLKRSSSLANCKHRGSNTLQNISVKQFDRQTPSRNGSTVFTQSRKFTFSHLFVQTVNAFHHYSRSLSYLSRYRQHAVTVKRLKSLQLLWFHSLRTTLEIIAETLIRESFGTKRFDNVGTTLSLAVSALTVCAVYR